MEHHKKMSFKESHWRSLVKSFIYRILSISGTGFLVWFVTKDIERVISITIVVQFFLIILYYLNERAWDKISWGRKVKKD